MEEVLDRMLAGVPYPAPQVPTIGRIVHYRLSAQEAEAINNRRHAARAWAQHGGRWPALQVREGNPVTAGDTCPMIVTAVWGPDGDGDMAVNGQLMLDGTDQHWVCTRSEGVGPGTWSWPQRG